MPLIPKKMSTSGKMLVLLIRILILGYTLVILFGEVILITSEKSKWCSQYDPKFDYVNAGIDSEYINKGGSSDHHVIEYSDDDDTNSTGKNYENPDYNTDPCRYERVPYLLYLTPEECDLCRRMLASVVFGGIIGYERRASDRPAGIRTMSLVSLGSVFFTISSQLAFKSSTMGWDSSRVTAAIPSGVGFLGAGLIWKGSVAVDGQQVQQVHGLTTAASVWLSAAVGVGCGGALYFTTAYATLLVLMVLRYGPKLYMQNDDDSYNDETEDEDEDEDEDDDYPITTDSEHEYSSPQIPRVRKRDKSDTSSSSTMLKPSAPTSAYDSMSNVAPLVKEESASPEENAAEESFVGETVEAIETLVPLNSDNNPDQLHGRSNTRHHSRHKKKPMKRVSTAPEFHS